MVANYTTVRSRRSIIEMFLDGTAGEVYASGRLATVESDEGESVQLVAYGHEILAEVSPDGKDVRLFTGHHGTVSKTVTDYIKLLGSILNEFEHRSVSAYKEAAPTTGIGTRSSRSAQYISNYINWWTSLSAVERDARQEVERTLQRRMAQIFN